MGAAGVDFLRAFVLPQPGSCACRGPGQNTSLTVNPISPAAAATDSSTSPARPVLIALLLRLRHVKPLATLPIHLHSTVYAPCRTG